MSSIGGLAFRPAPRGCRWLPRRSPASPAFGEIGIGGELREHADEFARGRILLVGDAVPARHRAASRVGSLRSSSAARAFRIASRVAAIGLVQRDHQRRPASRERTSSPSLRARAAAGRPRSPPCGCRSAKAFTVCRNSLDRRGRAADVLQIVDQQDIGAAQFFLEGKRLLVA